MLLLLSCGGSLPVNNPPLNNPPPPHECSLRQELPAGAPPVPTASDPWFGTAGNVLISNRNHSYDATIDFLWIGFDSPSNWQAYLTLNKQWPNGFWVGGHVVVNPQNPLGFYFDPDTTMSGEVTAEGAQTTLDFIKQDPSYFVEHGFYYWYVWATTESICD
jgi:hypothetical protein